MANKAILVVIAALLFSPLARANEAAIRSAIEPKLNIGKIEGIQPSPIPGLFEVRIRTEGGVDILYTDATGTHVIQAGGRDAGHILDIKNGRDLTEERLRKLNAIKFESLPLDLAVEVQRGNGKRVMAML